MRYWDKAWSLVQSCTVVSEGCQHCWQLALNKRFGGSSAPRFREDRLEIPLRRKKPTVWFVLSDLFHERVRTDEIMAALHVMKRTPQHTYLVLTKRPYEMWRIIRDYYSDEPLPNVWFGTTAENQYRLEERIGYLKSLPVANKFLSLEPLLAPVDLRRWIYSDYRSSMDGWHCPENDAINRRGQFAVIVGGESGPGHRPIKPEWVRVIHEQCEAAGIPWMLKQWHKQTDRDLDGRTYDDMPWRETNGSMPIITEKLKGKP